MKFTIRIATLSLIFLLNATAATKAIRFGKVWDGHHVIKNAVIIVEDDRIRSVTENGKIPAGAETITTLWFRPGLVERRTAGPSPLGGSLRKFRRPGQHPE